MPSPVQLSNSLFYNWLHLFSWCSKSDISRLELPEPPHSAMIASRDLRLGPRLSELRFQPIPARPDVDDEGYGQLRCSLHFLPHQGRHRLHLGPRHLEDQLVVHL